MHLLCEGMASQGHEVTLFATGDSQTSGRLTATYRTSLVAAMNRGEAYVYDNYISAHMADAVRRSHEFDVMHFNVGTASIPFAQLSVTPTVHTIQTEITVDDIWLLARYASAKVTALSCDQIEEVPGRRKESIATIHNAIDFGAYESIERSRSYLLSLSRVADHKGTREAIQFAQSVGLEIVVAGGPITAEEKTYFEEKISPLLSDPRVHYVGPVNDTQKRDLLAEARALIFPIKWREPFGIVMIEAMAAGVPVLATKIGSVPEVVDYGKTGFYADSVDGFEGLLERTFALKPASVRAHANMRFSSEAMIDKFLNLYRSFDAIQNCQG